MVKAKEQNTTSPNPHFGTVKNPIQMMEEEHETAGDIFKEISRLTNNYTPPEGACNTFRALYSKLDEFEQDLHHHIHLENNILHPKAINLENNK
jgi:regulator of cell morphogenesis and NO signaling